MRSKYKKEYEISYSDSDKNLRCKLPSILNFFSDVGTAHSEFVGETLDELSKNNYTWVFYKYDIKINKYPKYRENITIETECIGFRKFYSYRKYKIISSYGDILGEAIALFFLINTKSRRPTRISNKQYDLYDQKSDIKEKIKFDDIPDLEEVQYEKEFSIRYNDIDSNYHVNNCKYVELAIESVPVEILEKYEIKRVKVLFEKEATYGEKLVISSEIINKDNNIITVHKIENSLGFELTKLEIEWKRE